MLAWLRKPTSFEYVVGILAILTCVFWRNPLAQLDAGADITYFFVLQGLVVLAVFVVGSRVVFRRDKHFEAGQWLVGTGLYGLPIAILAGLHAGAGHLRSLGFVALGWIVIALFALVFALPKLEGRPTVRYPRAKRLRIMGVVAVGCVVAAIVTASLPLSSSRGPQDSPYRAWFPREAG